MARKPYIHQQPDGWYKKSSFYIWYMWREATAITTAITALNLFYGIACLAGSLDGLDRLAEKPHHVPAQPRRYRRRIAQQQNLV